MFARIINFIDDVAEFDYVKAGEVIIDKVIIITAFIVAITTYAYTACALWWEEHGEEVIATGAHTAEIIKNFAHTCYQAGVEIRPMVNRWVAYLADTTYYALTEAV